MCFGGPVETSSNVEESEEGFTSKEISDLRDEWRALPGANPEAIDRLANVLKNFKTNATSDEVANGIVSFLAFFFGKFDYSPSCFF